MRLITFVLASAKQTFTITFWVFGEQHKNSKSDNYAYLQSVERQLLLYQTNNGKYIPMQFHSAQCIIHTHNRAERNMQP